MPKIESLRKGTSLSSKEKIWKSLDETKKRFCVKESYDWNRTFYQYANRLAHVYFLEQNGYEARLMNVHFVNDQEMNGPKSVDEWRGAIRLMHRCLGLKEHLLRNAVIDIFIEVPILA